MYGRFRVRYCAATCNTRYTPMFVRVEEEQSEKERKFHLKKIQPKPKGLQSTWFNSTSKSKSLVNRNKSFTSNPEQDWPEVSSVLRLGG